MILEVIVLILGIPAGYLLAYLARDELIVGRKWFKVLMILSAILSIYFLIIKELTIFYTLLFVLIVVFISYKKSFDKKWIRIKM